LRIADHVSVTLKSQDQLSPEIARINDQGKLEAEPWKPG